MAGLTPIAVLGQLVSIGTLLAFVLVSIGVDRPASRCSRRAAPVPDTRRPVRSRSAGRSSAWPRWSVLPAATWVRLFIWLAIGLVIYASHGFRHASQARSASSSVV